MADQRPEGLASWEGGGRELGCRRASYEEGGGGQGRQTESPAGCVSISESAPMTVVLIDTYLIHMYKTVNLYNTSKCYVQIPVELVSVMLLIDSSCDFIRRPEERRLVYESRKSAYLFPTRTLHKGAQKTSYKYTWNHNGLLSKDTYVKDG